MTSSFQSCLLQFHPRELRQQLNLSSATTWQHDTNFPHCLPVNTPSEPLSQPRLVVFASMQHQQSYFLPGIVLCLDLPAPTSTGARYCGWADSKRPHVGQGSNQPRAWHMIMCSLNRQNISLGWHGCGDLGQSHDPTATSPCSLPCPQGILPVPLQRADFQGCQAEMQEGVGFSTATDPVWTPCL